MIIENLKRHYYLIREENYQTIVRWVIINSSMMFLKPVKIDEYIVIYPLDHINTELSIDQDDFDVLNPFIERIKLYKQINGQFGQHCYLLEVKMISLTEERMRSHGTGINIINILDDLLNILSLYYNRYFIMFPFNIFNPFNISEKYKERIKNDEIDFEDIEASSNDITNNFNILCNLRQEQFYLIEKSMKLYSNCLYSNETNPSISLCFIISSIEVLAQKYIEINENWENYSHLGFYNSLKKILKKIEDEDLKEKIFLEIGQKYIKETFQVKARYSNFLLRFVGLEFRLVEDSNDILFKEVVGDYYNLRSQYMHTGTEILTRDYNSPIIFNQTRKGKLKTFNEGSRLDIKYLPSFQFLIKLIKSSILNFLDYLYNNRNDEQDKQKYSPLDKRPRGMIEVTAKRNILAGTAVFGEQIHMKKQYIHIYERNKKIKQYSKEKNFEQLINEYTRILDKIKDSGDNERIILCYHNLGSNYLENKNLEPAFINLMEAKKISEENNLDNYKHSINYNLACYYSLKNDLENASDFLSKAIIDPQLKETAKTDKDLENLRNDARFNSLFD